jgi:hypothetical protein
MKPVNTILILLVLLAVFAFFTLRLKNEREDLLKAGYLEYTLPSAFVGPMALEFKGLTADFLLFKIMSFIGTRIVDRGGFNERQWQFIIKGLDTVSDLDPYFWDTYHFAEMFLAWHAQRPKDANQLLLKAMRHRPDDYRPPYYLGFNYYYFFKDNLKASEYLRQASKLPGSHYYLASLAARLSAFAFQHRIGIVFLKEMLKGQTDQRIIREFKLRIKTLEIMDMLEHVITKFQKTHHRLPGSLKELVSTGLIDKIPADPYGGKFMLLKNGRVYTTSKMLPIKKTKESR